MARTFMTSPLPAPVVSTSIVTPPTVDGEERDRLRAEKKWITVPLQLDSNTGIVKLACLLFALAKPVAVKLVLA